MCHPEQAAGWYGRRLREEVQSRELEKVKNLLVICRFTQQKEAFSWGVEACLCGADSPEYSQSRELLFLFTPLVVGHKPSCDFLGCVFPEPAERGPDSCLIFLSFYFQCKVRWGLFGVEWDQAAAGAFPGLPWDRCCPWGIRHSGTTLLPAEPHGAEAQKAVPGRQYPTDQRRDMLCPSPCKWMIHIQLLFLPTPCCRSLLSSASRTAGVSRGFPCLRLRGSRVRSSELARGCFPELCLVKWADLFLIGKSCF